MSDSKAFQVLPPSEYSKLTIEQKLAYLERAFRHSCAADPAFSSPAETAEQSAAAESKL